MINPAMLDDIAERMSAAMPADKKTGQSSHSRYDP